MGMAFRDDGASFGEQHRFLEDARQRQAAAPLPADFQRRRPGRYGTRDGIGRQRTPPWDLGEPTLPIQRDVHGGAGAACSVDGQRRAPGLGDQPETVAAEAGHMRIGDGQGGGGGHRCFDRIPAFGQNPRTGLSGEAWGAVTMASPRSGRHHHGDSINSAISSKASSPFLQPSNERPTGAPSIRSSGSVI